MRPPSENVSSLNGSSTLSMPALSSLGANSGVSQLARSAPRSPPCARACRAARPRRREDDVEDARPARSRTRLDQVGRALRVRPRDLELVAEAAADGGDQHHERDDDAEPAEEHPPGVRGAHPRPAASAPVAIRSCAASRPFVSSVSSAATSTSVVSRSFVSLGGDAHVCRPGRARELIGFRTFAWSAHGHSRASNRFEGAVGRTTTPPPAAPRRRSPSPRAACRAGSRTPRRRRSRPPPPRRAPPRSSRR